MSSSSCRSRSSASWVVPGFSPWRIGKPASRQAALGRARRTSSTNRPTRTQTARHGAPLRERWRNAGQRGSRPVAVGMARPMTGLEPGAVGRAAGNCARCAGTPAFIEVSRVERFPKRLSHFTLVSMKTQNTCERESAADKRLESLLNEHDVARLLKVSVATLRRRRLLRQKPDWVKLGASVRYHPDAIRRLIQDGERKTTEVR